MIGRSTTSGGNERDRDALLDVSGPLFGFTFGYFRGLELQSGGPEGLLWHHLEAKVG